MKFRTVSRVFLMDIFNVTVGRKFRRENKEPHVLFYHGVVDNNGRLVNADIESESIPLDVFVQQLKWLKKHYEIITVNELYNGLLNGTPFSGREIVLTFDDGYKNFLTTALPVLEEFDMPATLFLTTSNISTSELFPTTINRLAVIASSAKTVNIPIIGLSEQTGSLQNRKRLAGIISKELKSRPLNEVDEIISNLKSMISTDEWESLKQIYTSVAPMTWEDAETISRHSLVIIGSHCHDHICCHERQSENILRFQLKDSKREIEERLHISCDWFAYPNGNYTSLSDSIAEEIGYKMGFCTRNELVTSHGMMSLPRVYVPYEMTRFKYMLQRKRI